MAVLNLSYSSGLFAYDLEAGRQYRSPLQILDTDTGYFETYDCRAQVHTAGKLSRMSLIHLDKCPDCGKNGCAGVAVEPMGGRPWFHRAAICEHLPDGDE